MRCFSVSDKISTHSYSRRPFESFTMFRVIFASFLVFYGAHAQLKSPGLCPRVSVVQSFNSTEYLGLWYQYKLYPARFQPNGRCTTANYSLNSNDTVKVYNHQIDINTGVESNIEGWASLDNKTTGEAKLTVHFPDITPDGSYWVLGTDYIKYAVVWSCFAIPDVLNVTSSNDTFSNVSAPIPPPLSFSNYQFSWVLTRVQIPDEKTLTTAQQVIEANKLSNNYIITQQTNCQSQANTGWVPRSSFTYPVALGLFLMFRLVRLNSLTEFLV